MKLFYLAAFAAMAAPTGFGPGIQPIGAALSGDLNGDGKADTVWLMKVATAPATGVETANPWRPKAKGKPGKLGIAALLAGSPERRFLLTDGEFFDSPIWSQPEAGMISMQKRGGGRMAIAVATESSEDMYLYFTAGGWVLRAQ